MHRLCIVVLSFHEDEKGGRPTDDPAASILQPIRIEEYHTIFEDYMHKR